MESVKLQQKFSYHPDMVEVKVARIFLYLVEDIQLFEMQLNKSRMLEVRCGIFGIFLGLMMDLSSPEASL
jgi:hypothetical protein